MKRLTTLSLIFFTTALIFSGCSKDNNPASSDGNTGTLKVIMTDSPADYSEVNIVIDSVQAHIAGSDSTAGWVTLNNMKETYDLLKLVNGVNAVIGSSSLQAGSYSQIRLFLGSGCNVVANGQTYDLVIPSGNQSGIKLNIDAVIEAGASYLLTLDFDANQSIKSTGSLLNLKFILNPVIRAIATANTGSISGSVSPATVTSNVWAVAGTDSISTSTDASGGFKFQGLQPDTYSIYIAPNDTTYNDSTISNINVTSNNTTDIGTVMLVHK